MENQQKPPSNFVHTAMAWIVAGAALILYLLTLNHWVTLNSLPVAAKVVGWDWSPQLTAPLHFVLTYPIRWLPGEWQPIALNLLAAVLAALTLALLARSVALLPHDRTREQRQRERSEFSLLTIRAAWVPPLFAVLVAGLQLTFWEHATAYTGEMLDLALFAYVIRCLLEYRIQQRESWLLRMGFVYGLAASNNWAMIGFFPGFLVALVWIKGPNFFQGRFILRMLGCGLAGLSLYLLLPLVVAIKNAGEFGFIELLRTELGAQKNVLLFSNKSRVLILSLTSILPVLVMGIRWPSSFGDTSVIGAVLTNLMFRVVHGMFLVACLWVAFDPDFSPRKLGNFPFLTFYYLGALSVGYFSGYFLLVFGQSSGKAWRRPSPAGRVLNAVLVFSVWAAAIAVPAALVCKNLDRVRATNGPLLRQYASFIKESLPSTPAMVLGDDPYHLLLAEAVLNASPTAPPHMLLDTRALPHHIYQRYLHNRFPERWPDIVSQGRLSDPIDSGTMVQFVSFLTRSNQFFYLHPSFGYYFESLYLKPHGLVYQLLPYPTNAITPPPLSSAEIDQTQAALTTMNQALSPLPNLVKKQTAEAILIGSWLSRSLNYWGVKLQHAGRLEPAQQWFSQALALNPENHAALVNAKYNEALRSGNPHPIESAKYLQDLIAEYRANGPFDEPDSCFRLAELFAGAGIGLHRQAALNFIRVIALEPENLHARFWLANMYLLAPNPDKTLEMVSEIRSIQTTRPLQLENQIELVRLEALAHLGKANVEQAEKILLQAQQRHPDDKNILETLEHVYWMSAQFTNVLKTIEKQLQLAPDNLRALLNKGAVYIQMGQYKQGLEPLNRLVALQPKNEDGLRNRAIANLQAGNLDVAQEDYETLLKLNQNFYPAYYGLGEIAFQRKNSAETIKNYQLYLKYAPPADTPERVKENKLVNDRLETLKSAVK